MPFGDGTGPRGQGSAGQGSGFGSGKGKGRMRGNNSGLGTGGYCICPNCQNRIVHQRGNPCYALNCPKCGAQMVRE
jgi:hypothetical protein